MAQEVTRVTSYGPLVSPEQLSSSIKQSEVSKQTVRQGRADAAEIIHGTDSLDRLIVAVGPCSIHDPAAACEYAARVKVLRHQYSDELEIVMRSYTEKPRTRGGWKGLINDPDVDGSFQIDNGLHVARRLFADITGSGVPLISELLDTVSPQYLGEFFSIGAIGARTTECQLHRELVSGSSFPVGFKNATDGSSDVAIDAMEAANIPHHFLGITKEGSAAVINTSGNNDCFVILRGGKSGPNYDAESIRQVKEDLLQSGRNPRVMVDCSHGNAQKNFRNQAKVAKELCQQISNGEKGIFGVMIESNIHEGAQKPHATGLDGLKYGVSVTDACIGWQETEALVESLAEAVRSRRIALAPGNQSKLANHAASQKANGGLSVIDENSRDRLSESTLKSANGINGAAATNGHAKQPAMNGHSTKPVANGYSESSSMNGHVEKSSANGHAKTPTSNGYVNRSLTNGQAFEELIANGNVGGASAKTPYTDSTVTADMKCWNTNNYYTEPVVEGSEVSPLTNNLYELLETISQTSTAGIAVYEPGHASRSSTQLSYRELFRQAQQDAKLLASNGVTPGSRLLLHFSDHTSNIRWLWAAIIGGCLPAVSPPFVNDVEQRRKHLTHVNTLLQNPTVLTNEKLLPEFLDMQELNIRPVESLKAPSDNGKPDCSTAIAKKRSDLAVLMLTSGSTGSAKAVALRHGQIVVALAGKSRYHGTKKEDVFLNWIGMDHVANLMEVHLHAMSLGAQQVHVPAAEMLLEPMSFLHLIHRHRVAYTFAPNFFLASLRRILDVVDVPSTEHSGLDLSSLRALISGGEANVVETCAAVTKHMHQYKAIGEPIRPGFGMTETCAGSIYGLSCPSYDVEKSLEFASLGRCIQGLTMRIVNEDIRGCGANETGDLQLNGPALFKEYFNNPKATEEAFTEDGWFITGDRAYLDGNGYLQLTGRTKESIIINGVKHFPHELEAALDEALIPGMVQNHHAVFPHRPKNSDTETLCVVYIPTYDALDDKMRSDTTDSIANVAGMVCGVRPYAIIPLEKSQLTKSSLGKISRAKVRTAFENGTYDDAQKLNTETIRNYRSTRRETPSTRTEGLILTVICERFGLPTDEVSVTDSLLNFGVTSIEIISLKNKIQIALAIEEEIPLITILTNPTVRGMAKALDQMAAGPQPYDPVVTLREQPGKTPLWLVHPGVGEVLVFLNLAQYITDRSVYALRARGFNEGEEFFSSIEEVVQIYHANIKKTQPEGPYAIAGYSFGSMIAFEITKVFESHGDTVAFLGSFNLPPHIKSRMNELDWIEVVLNLSYFLDLTTEEHAHEISAAMHQQSEEYVLQHMLDIAPPSRLEELSLDKKKLSTWTSLAHAMQYAARDYDPSGTVASMDVFVAIPLIQVAKNKQDWIDNHLSHWKKFTREAPVFQDVPGAHYTMMSPKHILAFCNILRNVLRSRGL